MDSEHTFARDETYPSWFVNALSKLLSVAAFQLRVLRQDATHVQIPASAGVGGVAVAIQGRWRFIEATIAAAHPGGAAGVYDVYVTAADTAIVSTPDPFTDDTNYAFGVQVKPSGVTPTIVAGTVDIYRKVAEAEWDGAQITRVHQLVPALTSHAFSHEPGGDDPLTSLTDANFDAAHVDGAAGSPSLRTLGGGADQAAAGDDTRLSDERVPEDGSVTTVKVAAANKDGAAGTPSMRTLGAGGAQAVGGETEPAIGVTKAGSFNAVAGQMHYCTAALTGTLPNTPDADAVCGFTAEGGTVTIVRNGAGGDTLIDDGVTGLTQIALPKGASIVLKYLGGVWRVVRDSRARQRLLA